VSCSPIRVVPGAHRVVGPSTHLSSGPRDVHTIAACIGPYISLVLQKESPSLRKWVGWAFPVVQACTSLHMCFPSPLDGHNDACGRRGRARGARRSPYASQIRRPCCTFPCCSHSFLTSCLTSLTRSSSSFDRCWAACVVGVKHVEVQLVATSAEQPAVRLATAGAE
jgi:hypothetical protein